MLLVVIWNMVVKPVGMNGWFWGSIAVMVGLLGLVIVEWVFREQKIAAVRALE